jgi:PAS domain S-box-containing protein
MNKKLPESSPRQLSSALINVFEKRASRTAKEPSIGEARGSDAHFRQSTEIIQPQRNEDTVRRALSALNLTRDGVFIFDSQTLHFFYVNKGAVEQTGYSQQELLRMTPLDINPEFSEKSFRRMIAPLADGRLDSHFFTTLYRHKDGGNIPVEIILQHITSEDGENLFVAMARDVRERKQAEAALGEANDRALREYDCLLQRLALLAQASGSARDLNTIFGAILDFVTSSVPCSTLFISLYNQATSTRQVVYMWYNGKEIDVSDFEPVRVAAGPAGQTIKAGEVLIFGDYAKSVEKKDTNFLFGYDEDSREPRSTVMAPMKIKGDVIGLIEVQSYELEAYTREHTTALRMAANLAANAIENVRLLEQERLNGERIRISQKMESLGQLAAGVAHEINTPLQYVNDNTRFLKDAIGDLTILFDKYEKLLEESENGLVAQQRVSEAERRAESENCQYLLKEIPGAIEESLEGIERVSQIIKSMRDFAHPGSVEMKSVDLNKSIESTITVARNEWKYIADMEMDFDESLPPVTCIAGEVNQVILNLIVNAAHAISDVLEAESGGKGQIKVKTIRDDDWVEIQVSDSGNGIPPEVQSKIFDPFFTTKEVGKGTGQGLAISHQVVVGKHGGNLSFKTKNKGGTTFIIRLPITGLPAKNEEPAHLELEAA